MQWGKLRQRRFCLPFRVRRIQKLRDFCTRRHWILHTQALDFARRKLAVTYLLINEEGKISAFFTLTHKAVQIENAALSVRLRKKIARYAVPDRGSGGFVLSAFLIAQFGRDFTEHDITGAELMTSCLNILRRIQRVIGGGVVYLECENEEKLLQSL